MTRERINNTLAEASRPSRPATAPAPASRVVSTPTSVPHDKTRRDRGQTASQGDANAPPRTLILGCGNDLRGDDALGPIVANTLAELLRDRSDIAVDVCCGMTPDLADTMSRIDQLVFVDCAAHGTPGTVQRAELQPQREADIACVHLLDLPALLTWTLHLFGRVPRATAFTVAGERFELSETLSSRVAAAVPALIDAILAEVREQHHA